MLNTYDNEQDMITHIRKETFKIVFKNIMVILINDHDYFKAMINNDLNKIKQYGI